MNNIIILYYIIQLHYNCIQFLMFRNLKHLSKRVVSKDFRFLICINEKKNFEESRMDFYNS